MALSTISGTTGITDATITSAKLADFAAAVDLNGVELILDADQDTSITADTDDRIDFKIAGVEHISISNSSGDTIIKPMVDAKDIVFQQYDGNKILEINDGNYVAISGAAAGPGELRFYEDTDLGSHYTGFKAGNATASLSYVLPLADGTDGYQLTTDGSGTLSWAAAGVTLSGSTNNTIATVTGASALAGEANLTFDGSTLAVTGAATVSTTLTATGVVTAAGFTIGSAVIGEAELEILDGANVTTTELNLIDGGTARGTDALASGDGILINDAGTMKMTNVDTVKTFMQSGLSSVGGASGVDFNDNVKARFGTGNDLEIYHDASNTYINENGTGDLIIKGTSLKLRSSGNEDFVVCTADGDVEIRHNDVKKFETTAAGITVTGTVSQTAPPAGSVLQTIVGYHTTDTGTTSETWTSSGIDATITPSATSSKIMILASVPVESATANRLGVYSLYRGASTALGGSTYGFGAESAGATSRGSFALNYLDTPATTSATTYAVFFRTVNAGYNIKVCGGSSRATILLLEIAG